MIADRAPMRVKLGQRLRQLPLAPPQGVLIAVHMMIDIRLDRFSVDRLFG
jgi:hypothetical protein